MGSEMCIRDSDVSDATSSTAFPSDWVAWGATDGSTALVFNQGASSHTQHTGTGTLTITGASGTSTDLQSETFLVTINDDAIDEEDTESIYFALGGTLTNATAGTENEFRLDITDNDDLVRYSFATSNTGNVPETSGTEDATPSFRVYLLDPTDQTQTKESGRRVTINWTMDLTGGDDDDTEAGDFTAPSDFCLLYTSPSPRDS